MALEGIAQPETLSTGIALLLIGIFAITGYIGLRLYSPVSLLAWAFGIVTLMFTIVLDVNFIFVWLIIGIIAILEAISMTVFVAGYGKV